ncbi:MAG: hypothetical protein NVS1B14_06250 [Vulcanimicrobiaceae bacterium]
MASVDPRTAAFPDPLGAGQFRVAAAAARVGLFEADVRGAFTYVDATWCSITGLTAAASHGHGWMHGVHPADVSRVMEAFQRPSAERRANAILYRHLHADGTILWLRRILGPHRDAEGKLRGFQGTVTDVTKLVELGNLLEENRGQFRVLADSMPQMVWSALPDGSIDYFNQQWVSYTGLALDSMDERGVKGVVHPDELRETWERWNRSLESGEPYEIEYRLRCAADGSFRWFIARAVALKDDDGKITRWIGTATDIDEQRRLSENLKFVLDAAKAFSSSLNVETISRQFADLAIRQFADWCFIVLLSGPGQFRTAAIAHRDEALVRYVQRFQDRYPVQSGSELAVSIEKKSSLLIPSITREQIAQSATDAEHLEVLQRLDMYSAMIVPLCWQDQAYGGIVLVSSESKRSFTPGDLQVAEMVAGRAALAIHNAQIFTEERSRSQRLAFLGKASDALFESLEVERTFEQLANVIIPDVADFSIVLLLEDNEALRVAAAAHRDSSQASLVDLLVGERIFEREGEADLLRSLHRHRAVVQSDGVGEQLASRAQPYLRRELGALRLQSSLLIPLHSRGQTLGALIAYYNDSGRTYGAEDIPVFLELGRRASIALENAQTLARERRIAQTLQEASLPAALPDIEGISLDAVYAPSENEAQIGGDWYDAFTLPDGSLVITVGDVTGRGVKAASIMAKARQALAVIPLYEKDPARMLDAADFVLRRRHADEMVTAFVAIIDPERKTLRYANAGHPYPIARRSGKLEELKADGLPLGLRPSGTSAPAENLSLEGVELLTFFTDGLVESTHDVAQGERRLRDVLSTDAILHTANPAHVIQSACLFDGSPDDVAILTVTFQARKRWNFESQNAKAAQSARGDFVDYLHSNVRETNVDAAELAFGELVGNVVRHAPGPIEIELEWAQTCPVLHVLDRGPEFTPSASLPQDVMSEAGRGLFLVSNVGRSFQIERIPHYGNHIAVSLPYTRR